MRFIIYLLILVSINSSANDDMDEKLTSQIVGSWVLPKTDNSIGAIMEFKNNGSWSAYIFKSSKCEIKVSESYGDWFIKNQQLQTVVTDNELLIKGGVVFPIGYKNTDVIISVNKKLLSLQNESGEKFQRIRSQTCVN
ncbi:hypothetical protein H4J58_00200 [Colwellia sp. MB3u-70]|jgi:hypothetical protein|uniref:hypothetical protein n=1 Tax=unclassified Colwellia TaxID=196834 RepID=UPI0015F48BF5|nr:MULTISPECIES: hypothetical protein [unclassified Colwellia]MBA6290730.1 hypothetical protein [Colwellia sp. MB3u-8]MBA6305567.1 hypothetical protein [Colwellia sp. MB3u-70]